MSQDPDVQQQVLSYVRHQADKGLADLAALMERTAADCARCLEGISEGQASFKYDEEWSVKEVLGHMLLSTAAVNGDIARAAEGKEMRPLYGEGPTAGADRPIAELRRALADQWSETVSLVGSLSDEAGEKPVPEHPTFGPLNGKEWIAFQRLHAMDHIQQIEMIKANPDYPKD
jgi:hypothetical protein